MRHFAVLFSAAVLLVACGQKTNDGEDGGTDQPPTCDLTAGDSFNGGTYRDPDGGTTQSVAWEQECSVPPTPLKTGQAENGLCTIADRCKEVQCTCATGTKRYAARACNDGLCTDQPTACTWALGAEPRLCQ